tara:strand:- start:13202 stop:13408 length:207 start_codon:yes stop_codon:yes gene_type:complete
MRCAVVVRFEPMFIKVRGFAFSLFLSICAFAQAQNHAPLNEAHVFTAEEFIENRLKKDGLYDPLKIQI